jgi:WD40 repeat protein
MWNVLTGRLLWKRPISFIQKADDYYTLNAFAWSPDQTRIASGSGNGTVQLWDANTGNFLWIADIAEQGVADVAFSSDGKMLGAIPYSEAENAARVFEVDSGKLIAALHQNICTQKGVVFDPAGKALKIANLDGNISWWDISTGEPITGHTPECKSMYSYGGERSFSDDLSLSVRRTEADAVVIEESGGKVIRNTKLNDSKLFSLVNSKAQIAVVGEYGGFHLYNLSSGEDRMLDDCVSGSAIDLSNDGKLFAQSCDGFKTAITITNLETGKTSLLDGHPSTIHALLYSPDYSLLALAGNDGNVYLLDPETRLPKTTLVGNGSRIMSLAFSRDGKRMFTGDDHSTLREWELGSSKLLKEVQVNDRFDDIDRLEISPDGSNLLAVVSSAAVLLDSNLVVQGYLNTPEGYSSTSGTMTYTFSSVPIEDAVFDVGAARVITGHGDGTIRIWDSVSGHQVLTLKIAERILFVGSNDASTALVISATGKRANFRLVNTKTGKTLAESKAFDSSYLEKMSMSRDHRFVAVSDISGDMLVCNIQNMSFRELDNRSGNDSVAFSRDDSTFFIGGENQNLKLFQTAALKELWQLLPEFEPGQKEKEMAAARDLRVKAIRNKKRIRESQAFTFAKTNRARIYITFDHYGDMSDPGSRRMAESNVANESKAKKVASEASAVWLRLNNNSSLPIEVPTQSMYMRDPNCFHLFPNGEKMYGLCKDREIYVWFGLKDSRGKWVPYGFDFGSSVNLLPKSSVLFPVPLSVWNKNYSVVFNYSFQNVRASTNDRESDFGPKIELKVTKQGLLK